MSQHDSYDAIIIGGGVAGLAAAIRLKKRFRKVLIVEKNDHAGGKLDEMTWRGFRWDKGPSLFTEPELVDALFELWNKNPRDYFSYRQLETSCAYYFSDQSRLSLSADDRKSREEITAFADSNVADQFERYKTQSKQLFEQVGDYFISNPQPGTTSLLSKDLRSRYKYLIKKEVRNSLNDLNENRFSDQRLVQLFNRYGTYNGSNPYKMSGLYSTIPHVELNKGAFFPDGGIRSIANALIALADEVGVEFAYNSKITAKQLPDGNFEIRGDVQATTNRLICAIDHVAFYKHVLNQPDQAEKWKKPERSTSGLIFYWAVKDGIPNPEVHNILFSPDYKSEFDLLFQQKKLVEDPTFYIHISSVVTPEDAEPGHQNWFVMINTPAGVIPDINYRNQVKRRLFDRIKEQFGVDVADKILFEDFWDCHAIQEHSGSYLGALYGPSSNSLTASIKRHGNRSKKFKNLYFCGGTVHPGGGIPLVLRSAKIVSDSIK